MNVSSPRLVILPFADDPGSWDPPAGEPSIWAGEGHDLAEPETLDAEILHMCA